MDHSPHWDRLLRKRLSRRRLIGTSATGLVASAMGGCSFDFLKPPPPTVTPRPRSAPSDPMPEPYDGAHGMSRWSRHARIANAAGLGEDPTEEEMRQIIRVLLTQHVSVVEADTVLSDWISEEEFHLMMVAARHFNGMVHGAGLHVVWYYPSLEILSSDAIEGPSFYKLHPDWAQVSLVGQPNVFVGGAEELKHIFWVEDGVESMWLSPNSPWRDYFLTRVKWIAQTGADGIWPDVPLYFDPVHLWCDTSKWAKEAFKSATGLDTPTRLDWSNPTWRRWVEWRHRNLNQWCLDIAAAGRSVNPDFETFIETVTCDHMDATTMGLDGAYLRLAEGVTQAWEVDTVSDDFSMYYATDDDWICMIAIYKFCRAASGRKPAWTFTKGWEPEDAAQVIAECLATGCNPYEVQVPGKTIGVSPEMRTRWYGFVRANTARLFDARSLAKVALYHSSASRDYVAPARDETPSSGVYSSTDNPFPRKHWWSIRPADSRYAIQWLGEYTGMLKALVHAHIPFDVLTSPTLEAADLQDFRVLVAPDLQAVSDNEATIIRHFVYEGGTLLVTGPNPTGWNEYGDERPDYALADVLGISRRAQQAVPGGRAYGAGRCVYFPDLPGLQYLRNSTRSAYERVIGTVRQSSPVLLTTDADPRVHIEARELKDEWILHMSNLTGVRGTQGFTVTPTSFSVSVEIPEGREPSVVGITTPDRPTPEVETVPFSAADGFVTFAVSVRQYGLAVITWQ